jgi:NAD(P)-dependent dehydrogenase (short-subunit alcohol dehydrogenase family)
MQILDPFDFSGRVALITGGGTGIGRATARLFAERGADVALAGRKREPLEETAALVTSLGRRATVLPTDVKDAEACEALAAAAMQAHGRIDYLVNNAGGSRAKSYTTWTLADFDDMLALNLRSVWVLSRAVASLIRESGGGAIVNISSGASLFPVPHSAPYGAAKAAVNNLTAVMAVDLASWGIRVNCVAPGTIKTEGYVRAMDRMSLDPDVSGGANPLGRPGLPDEIAWPVLFLCSPASGFMTGETISVAGGPVGWQKHAPQHET